MADTRARSVPETNQETRAGTMPETNPETRAETMPEVATMRWPWCMTVLPLIAALLAPLPAQDAERRILDEEFQRFDRDRDGRVTRAEFPGSDEQFAQLDADDDGRVTREEFGRSPIAQRLLVARRKDDEAPRQRVDPAELALRRLEAAQVFDANKDGRISRSEWTGAQVAFDELDVDRSGVLDRADKAMLRKQAPAAAPAPDLSRVREAVPSAEELLKQLDENADQQLQEREVARLALAELFAHADTNGDKALDLVELRRLVAFVNETVAARARGDERPRAFQVPFSTWDKNKDGRLEAAEWIDRKYLFARIDQDRDAAVTRDEIERYVRAVENDEFVRRFDLDGDGKVTPAEFGGSPDAFRRADRNGDGAVSRADR